MADARWDGGGDLPVATSVALTDEVLIRRPADMPAMQVKEAPVSLLQAALTLAGSLAPTSIGQANVSVDNATWVSTGIVIPSTANYGFVRVDLQRVRGLYLVDFDQWRGLGLVGHGGQPDDSKKIPLTEDHYFSRSFSFGIGRVTGDILAVQYDGGQGGLGAFLVQATRIG